MIKFYSQEKNKKTKTIFMEIVCQCCNKQILMLNQDIKLIGFTRDNVLETIKNIFMEDIQLLRKWRNNVGKCHNCYKNDNNCIDKNKKEIEELFKSQDFTGMSIQITNISKDYAKDSNNRLIFIKKKNNKNIAS